MKIVISFLIIIWLIGCQENKKEISLINFFFQDNNKDSLIYFIDKYGFETIKPQNKLMPNFYFYCKKIKDTSVCFYPFGMIKNEFRYARFTIKNFDTSRLEVFEKMLLDKNTFDTIIMVKQRKIYSKHGQYDFEILKRDSSVIIGLNYCK